MAIFTRRVPGVAYDEIYLSESFDRAVTTVDVERLVRAATSHGASHCLRVSVLGDTDIDPDLAAGSGYLVAGHQYPQQPPRGSVEVQAIAPAPGAPVEVTRLAPATFLIESDAGGAAMRRLVYTVGPMPGATVLEQSQAALRAVERRLAECGLSPSHIDRTWYFVGDIARTYGELNKARDEVFDRWEITSYPASTGIGASLPGPARIAVVVEATALDGAPVATPFDTSLQCPPSEYGPRFSRANRSRRNGTDVINISGISSIDDKGQSLRSDDPEVVVDYTMSSFIDLLRTAGAGPADVCSCYVYGKDEDVLAAYRSWLDRSAVDLPALVNLVDICRPELRFELEARAIRPT